MSSKKMLTLPVVDQAAVDGVQYRKRWFAALHKVWLYLKGDTNKENKLPDPAAPIISQIENKEIARIVRDLHYRTPKSLKAMRNACESCFVLPDDCPYYDYSIFDVKKAKKKIMAEPDHTHQEVVAELRKINEELAYHISEALE